MKLKHRICGLWFMHDISPLDYFCRNCGMPETSIYDSNNAERFCLERVLRDWLRRLDFTVT